MILEGLGVSSDFKTFSVVDTTLCVISDGLPYSTEAFFNVAFQENSLLSKRM